MKPSRAFSLLAEPHTVTQRFVLFQMDRNVIFLYLVMYGIYWYRCICV